MTTDSKPREYDAVKEELITESVKNQYNDQIKTDVHLSSQRAQENLLEEQKNPNQMQLAQISLENSSVEEEIINSSKKVTVNQAAETSDSQELFSSIEDQTPKVPDKLIKQQSSFDPFLLKVKENSEDK